MASSIQPVTGPRTFSNGFLFGVPVRDFGWFASLLTSFALGFVAFFLATFLAIVVFLFRISGGHQVDFALTYRYFGLPCGIVVLLASLVYLGFLWTRRITRREPS